ncbi:MAG: nucleotidyl transferase AbiEii/AbiGii toxin family protein [Thermodesulfobacteriota bacterium]
MIDRRELLEKARERKLTLGMIEKDYVLGWLLFGLSGIKGLTFKGGTALSKIYFPKIWRLSEDLDFVFVEEFRTIIDALPEIFQEIEKTSQIKLILKSRHSNPDYLQLKIQYDAVLGKNWVKVDVTREMPVDTFNERKLSRAYSDYPSFLLRIESVEEICAQKIRSLVERKKCRDYYDVWQLMKLKLDMKKMRKLTKKKFEYKGIAIRGLEDILPSDLFELLEGYWDREVGRLVYPVPNLKTVIKELREFLKPTII